MKYLYNFGRWEKTVLVEEATAKSEFNRYACYTYVRTNISCSSAIQKHTKKDWWFYALGFRLIYWLLHTQKLLFVIPSQWIEIV